MAKKYCPDRGDVVRLAFNPQAGHEQAGHRPALVLSPAEYNRKVGLALFCPITSRIKGYPFEVGLPEGSEVKGVVLADQVKSLDYKVRGVSFCCKAGKEVIRETLEKLGELLEPPR